MFKAVLKTRLKYTDTFGVVKHLYPDCVINVQLVPKATTWVNDQGKKRVLKNDKFVAIFNNGAVYINQMNFKTVD